MAMTGKPTFRKPAPEGIVEHIGLGKGEGTAMVELDDGSLMDAGSRERLSHLD